CDFDAIRGNRHFVVGDQRRFRFSRLSLSYCHLAIHLAILSVSEAPTLSGGWLGYGICAFSLNGCADTGGSVNHLTGVWRVPRPRNVAYLVVSLLPIAGRRFVVGEVLPRIRPAIDSP